MIVGSVRLPEKLQEKVREVAVRRGITRSEVFRRALESYCDQELTTYHTSRYDDVIGIAEGPVDGSERVSDIYIEGLKKKYG
jgi:metal-responsive CopG/Arc/MetJ family transcriptional regulator